MVNKKIMKIDKFTIGEERVFIIAEIGNNHNGDFNRAKLMIDKAVEMGADCAKFQMRNMKHLYRSKSINKNGDDLGTEYIIDLLEEFELTIDQHKDLKSYCTKKGILYMCTPWDIKTVDVLESFDVKAFKVASADLTNIPLLEKLSNTGKPLILSTGMSTVDEVKLTVSLLNDKKVDFALLHCNSTYPAPFEDINLKWINSLKKVHPIIGYSGHERGINVTIASVALGAKIVERHFTLDRNMEGPDHSASLEFEDFKSLIEGIREVERSLGQGKKRFLSQGEMINRENLGKSLVAAKNLKKGSIINREDIKVLSPGQGLSPQNINKLIGKTLMRDVDIEDFFFMSDLGQEKHLPSDYKFEKKWGVPVRFHDFEKFNKLIQPDIYEFHLSYADMNLDPSKFIPKSNDCGFVVHAPELFEGSHLMDLASPDLKYRQISIDQTQRVIDITRTLKEFFPNEDKPLIVANIGGFSMDEPFNIGERKKYYDRFINSLHKLDTDGVELIPQTMAPFPWHFGGQRFQNLFVEIDEIVNYCEKFKLKMCFDISHSMLTCNHLNQDFYEFAEKILPFTAHIHMGDARGVNGEGLQIGDGEIDFIRLNKIIQNSPNNISFIPEIWQGHKNEGEGFWIALERLNGKI